MVDIVHQITITKVTGAIKHGSDFSKITAMKNQAIVFEGLLDIPDEDFAMPIAKEGGAPIFVPASVEGGKFSISLNIEHSGRFSINEELLNREFSKSRFGINQIDIYILNNA